MAVKKIIWHCTYKATNDKLCKWIRSLVFSTLFEHFLSFFPFASFCNFLFFWFRIFQFIFFLYSFWLGFSSFFHAIFWIRIFVVFLSPWLCIFIIFRSLMIFWSLIILKIVVESSHWVIYVILHQTARSLEPYSPCICYHSSRTKWIKTRQYGSRKNSFSQFVDNVKQEVE